MAKQLLLNARLFVGGADLSGQSNKISVEDTLEEREVTNWRSGGAKEWLAGLEGVKLGAEGQWEAGDPSKIDDATWASRRVIEPWTVAANSDSDIGAGSLVYLTQALRTEAKLFGAVGEVAGWSIGATGSWPLARGLCVHPSGVPRTATGSGTVYQLGAVPEGRHLYATLHVLSVAGTSPSLTVTVQSDDAAGFASPTTRATFSAASLVGGQALRIDPPVTDQYWRIGYTISGTTPSFLFIAALGIE